MPDLAFRVDGAEVAPYAAAPFIDFRIGIDAGEGVRIRNVMLQCQIRIEVGRRHYDAVEQRRLVELFGEPGRWSRTLQGLLWTHAQVVVPAFESRCTVALPVPCSFDFNVGATKYFDGLQSGDVPLVLLFSGAVFYEDAQGLRIDQIAWDKEARHRLPVATWNALMARYYPDTTWLRVPRGLFERIADFKRQHGLTSYDRAIERLLDRTSDCTPERVA